MDRQTDGRAIAYMLSRAQTVRVTAESNILGQILIACRGKDVDFYKLFAYPLNPVPWSLATPDGGFAKTDKAQLLHALECEADTHSQSPHDLPFNCVVVIDGNALLQAMTHLPDTFEELECVFKCLPKAQTVHFVTDSYHPRSIKDMERHRRGQTKAHVLGGPKTKLPHDFSAYMHNSDNKTQLIHFLLDQWRTQKYAAEIGSCVIYYACATSCFKLQQVAGSMTAVEVDELQSSQEEADTRIILHCLFESRRCAQDSLIVVRSPDTDVLVVMVYFSSDIHQTLLFDTGAGNKRRLVNVTHLAVTLGQEMAKALPGLHAFTGCDCTSEFVRKGKKLSYKRMKNNAAFLKTFAALGENATTIPPEVYLGLRRFVCSMYGRPGEHDVNNVCTEIFQVRFGANRKLLAPGPGSGIDLSLLPPCDSSLALHSARANYQCFLWKSANVKCPNIPPPSGNGWMTDRAGNLEVEWVAGEVLPQDVAEILAEESVQQCSIDEDDIDEDDEFENVLDVIFEEEDVDLTDM